MYYIIIFFVVGLLFGSFFNVVGLRLPKAESIIKPRSHCTKCNRTLKWYELIPVVSYVIQLGKCRGCETRLSVKYPLFELLTGVCYTLCYIVFGLSLDIIIPLTLVSALIIIIVSDTEYMVIPDEVILITSILLISETFFIKGIDAFGTSLLNGALSFGGMYLIKILGDFIFKKESLGGGDIKLMFMIGLVFSFNTMVVILFLSSFMALPYSIAVLLMKKDPIVPYGPFISLTAITLLFLKLTEFSLIDLVEFIV